MRYTFCEGIVILAISLMYFGLFYLVGYIFFYQEKTYVENYFYRVTMSW